MTIVYFPSTYLKGKMNFLILFLSLTLQATLSEEIENPLVINYEADLYSDKKGM